MMDGGGGSMGAFFPVIFFDGEREIEIGDVGVYPTMNYKLFQSVISQKMAISPHQITIYFERYTAAPSPLKDKFSSSRRRRSPVTNKFDFSAVFYEPESFFWVVLKRSRRLRRHKSKQGIRTPISDDGNSARRSHTVAPEKPVILRRNSWPHGDQFSQPAGWYAGADYVDYANNRMRVLGRERERYLMSLNLNSDLHSELHMKGAGSGMDLERVVSEDGASCSSSGGGGGGERMVVCGVCAAAGLGGQKEIPFHCCKCDPMVNFGFRSPAGPIARPSNHSG